MTSPADEADERAVPLPRPAAESQGVQARAREVTGQTALLLKPVTPPPADGESSAEQAVNRALNSFGQISKLYAKAAHGHSLLHLDPPSVASVWAGHRKAAAHWNSPVARGLRLTYGVLHTTAVIPVYIVLWAISTPAGLLVTAALLTAAAVWL